MEEKANDRIPGAKPDRRGVDDRPGEGRRGRCTVLVTGDAEGLPGHLREILSGCGCELLRARSADDLCRAETGRPDLVLLHIADLQTANPDRLQALRERCGRPIVCLLPCPGEGEIGRVGALPADTVVFTPVRPDELQARIRLLLWAQRRENGDLGVEPGRRGRAAGEGKGAQTAAPRRTADLVIDEGERLAICGSRRVPLTTREYALLALLASDPGRTFPVREIVEAVWPSRPWAPPGYVHQCVYALRKKLEADPHRPRHLLTVPTVGYRLEP